MAAMSSRGGPDARPGTSPLALVREWYEGAVAAGIPEADAMALATATLDGRPSVRFVLLKGIDDDGIRFFTNYGSRKARELDANPRAAVTLYWLPVARSVRMEGPVERLPADDSDAYFASRSRGARLGAWASAQGTALRDRDELDERVRAVAERFPDDIPRPDHWGGYKLRPDAIELWQGRPNRLHDREHFLRAPDGVWRSERLSP
jgi:pyridoxamine 5'-phosphate oxidase